MISIMPSAHSLVFTRAFCDSGNVDAVTEQMRRALGEKRPDSQGVECTKAEPSEKELEQMPVVDRPITSPFGYRVHPIFHRRIFHEGLDFRAELGEEVHCVLDGVIKFSGKRGGFGNAVYIYHPVANSTSMYAHMSSLKVKEGQVVKQGDVVGLAGSTGYSTGVHLHFGIKSPDGKWQDPLAFLKKVPHYELIAIRQRDAVTAIATAPEDGATTDNARTNAAGQPVVSAVPVAPTLPAGPASESAVAQQTAEFAPEVAQSQSTEPVKFPFGEPMLTAKPSLSTLILLRDVAKEKVAPMGVSTEYGAAIVNANVGSDGENTRVAQDSAMDVHTQIVGESAPIIAPSAPAPHLEQVAPKAKTLSLAVRLLLSSIKTSVTQDTAKS